MATVENIDVPRNGHAFVVRQYFEDNGEPADLTGCTLSATARDIAGGTVIATATLAVTVAAEGVFSMKWLGADFDAYGEAQALGIASYDLKIVRADSVIDVPMRGHLNIIPECTA